MLAVEKDKRFIISHISGSTGRTNALTSVVLIGASYDDIQIYMLTLSSTFDKSPIYEQRATAPGANLLLTK